VTVLLNDVIQPYSTPLSQRLEELYSRLRAKGLHLIALVEREQGALPVTFPVREREPELGFTLLGHEAVIVQAGTVVWAGAATWIDERFLRSFLEVPAQPYASSASHKAEVDASLRAARDQAALRRQLHEAAQSASP